VTGSAEAAAYGSLKMSKELSFRTIAPVCVEFDYDYDTLGPFKKFVMETATNLPHLTHFPATDREKENFSVLRMT